MNKAAAIAAQLVDVRNVNTHKCVRLIIDVPAEQAMLVMEAFGWPTQVNPVPVAIARLNPSKLAGEGPSVPVEAAGLCGETLDRPHKVRKPVAADKRLAQQAGMLCADPVFWKYLIEREGFHAPITEMPAANAVRVLCMVDTRAEILPGTEAGEKWEALHSRFTAWKLVA